MGEDLSVTTETQQSWNRRPETVMLPAPLPQEVTVGPLGGGNMKVRGWKHSRPEFHTAPRRAWHAAGDSHRGKASEADSLLGYFRASGPSLDCFLPESISVPSKTVHTRVNACQPACQCLYVSLPKGTHTSEQSLGEVRDPLPCRGWLGLAMHAPSHKLKP